MPARVGASGVQACAIALLTACGPPQGAVQRAPSPHTEDLAAVLSTCCTVPELDSVPDSAFCVNRRCFPTETTRLNGLHQAAVWAESALAWVDHADPARMFEDSARAGHVEFLEVCGYTCWTPNLDSWTYLRCYRAVPIRRIDPTYDVIYSATHDRLKAAAAQFAADYNTRVARWLDDSGRRTCAAGEQWSEYWKALEDAAGLMPLDSNVVGRGLLPSFDPGKDGYDFQLYVAERGRLTTAHKRRLCQLAPVYGIVGPVRFSVTRQRGLGDFEPGRGFICRRGRVAA